MDKVICMECGKKVDYEIREEKDIAIVKGEQVEYNLKVAYCKKCGQEVWVSELDDYNANAPAQQYCINHKLITITKIQEIIEKYDIGKRPLSQLLGWGALTITRFLDGQIPTPEYSEKLVSLLDTKKFIELLNANKSRISDSAYRKASNKLKILTKEVNSLFNGKVLYYLGVSSYTSVYSGINGGKKWKQLNCVC